MLALQRVATRPSTSEHFQTGAHRAPGVVRPAGSRSEASSPSTRYCATQLPASAAGRLTPPPDRARARRCADPPGSSQARERARTDQIARQDRELSPLGRVARRIGLRRRTARHRRARLRRWRHPGRRAATHRRAPPVMLVEQPIDDRREPQRVATARVVQHRRATPRPSSCGARRRASQGHRRPPCPKRTELQVRCSVALEQARFGWRREDSRRRAPRPVRRDDEELRTLPCVGRDEGRVDGRGVAPPQILGTNERLPGGERLHGFGEARAACLPSSARRPVRAGARRWRRPPSPEAGAASRARRDRAATTSSPPASSHSRLSRSRIAAQPSPAPLHLECLTARAADAVGAEAIEEMIEKRCLAGAGFAGDEDHLAPPLHARASALVQ